MDLVSDPENLARVETWVSEINPRAQVLRSTMSKVALPALLGLEAVDRVASIGHETTALTHQWKLSENPKCRREPTMGSYEETTSGHLHAEEMFQTQTVQLDSAQLQIGQLTRWLEESLPNGVLRLKGFAAVAELNGRCVILQMSGACRFTVDTAATTVSGVQIVLIGLKGAWDCDTVRAEIEGLCTREPDQGPAPLDVCVPEIFQVLTSKSVSNGAAVVRFEPMRKFGRLPAEAMSVSGFGLDDANLMLVQAINMSTERVVVLDAAGLPENEQETSVGVVLPYGSCSQEALTQLWSKIEHHARKHSAFSLASTGIDRMMQIRDETRCFRTFSTN